MHSWTLLPPILAGLLPAAGAVDLFDPRVFNPYFYCGTNGDLTSAGISSIAACRDHWSANGVHEGRQASGSFSVQQYLARYPDLQKAFGKDYAAAINHYLTMGFSEGRLGYVEGGAGGRFTVSAGNLFLSASERMAGAIDSLVWNDVEFTNVWDHGRELQMAVTVGRDGFGNRGECYNPTEAGSGDDLLASTTTSRLLGVQAAGAELRTTSLPAFWMQPGEHHANPTAACSVAVNTELLSKYQMSKQVVLGAYGQAQAIQFAGSVLIPEDIQAFQLEGPTQYMTQEFSSFYAVDRSSGQLTPLSTATGEESQPLVFARPDGSAALGMHIVQAPAGATVNYAKFQFLQFGEEINRTNKWSIVMRTGPLKAGTTFAFEARLCVGTLKDVQGCMAQGAGLLLA